MSTQTTTSPDVTVDPRVEVVAYNLFAMEVGFSKLDLMDFNHSAARRAPWNTLAVKYLAEYDAAAAEAAI